MEIHHNPLLDWSYFCHEKSMEELKQSLLLTAMELENTRIKVDEDMKMKDDQLMQLNDLLNTTIKQRDEAQKKCQILLYENLLLQQSRPLISSGVTSIEDEPRKITESNNGFSFSSSDSDESIFSSSPPLEAIPPPPEQQVSITKPLPEKGKFLQAVMKAGPLLQNLLLAGPLPKWRHPPPPLDTYQILPPPLSPPSVILPIQSIHHNLLLNLSSCNNNNINNFGTLNRKRGLNDEPENSSQGKFQRVILQ